MAAAGISVKSIRRNLNNWPDLRSGACCQEREYESKTISCVSAFSAMGFVDALGPFVSLAKKEFQISTTMALLIPFVGGAC